MLDVIASTFFSLPQWPLLAYQERRLAVGHGCPYVHPYMGEILYVSKPVGPPWNDSSKNLVRDVAWGMHRHRPVVMVRRDEEESPPAGAAEAIYTADAGGFAPTIMDQARVMRRLMTGRRCDLWHFFFAPNPKSSRAGAFASRFRRVPTVQTVCSAPRPDLDLDRALFADCTVVLSESTRHRFVEAGISESRIRAIPPGIEPLEPLSHPDRRRVRGELGLPLDSPVLVYPGDLEFGGGADLVVESIATLPAEAHVVMACRTKTPAAIEAEAALRARVAELGAEPQVTWLGETSRIHDLLGCADVVLLPTASLYAKMDYPLVVLEAMSMGCPVIVSAGTAAAELSAAGAVVVDFDAEALGGAIDGLLTSDAERARCGEEGRVAVRGRFSRQALAEAYEALYDELLG